MDLTEIYNLVDCIWDNLVSHLQILIADEEIVSVMAKRPVQETVWHATDYLLNIWAAVFLAFYAIFGIPYNY